MEVLLDTITIVRSLIVTQEVMLQVTVMLLLSVGTVMNHTSQDATQQAYHPVLVAI